MVETSDDYPHVVATLDPKTRVIECVAGIQWIIQRRLRETKYPWEGVSFCRTREALVRLAGPHPTLTALPDRFPEARCALARAGGSPAIMEGAVGCPSADRDAVTERAA
jgi:hypothetical protein